MIINHIGNEIRFLIVKTIKRKKSFSMTEFTGGIHKVKINDEPQF